VTHLLCKIYPRDKSFIGGVLPNNKRIEAPTEASLNPKEYDLCRKQATITVSINAGEKDVSTLSFADALKLATNKIEKEKSFTTAPAQTMVEKVEVKKSVVTNQPKIQNTKIESPEDNTNVTTNEIITEDDNSESDNNSIEIKTNFNNNQYKNKSLLYRICVSNL